MKKTLSLIMAFLMLMSVLVINTGAAKDEDGNWVPDNAKWDKISRDGVVARFAIGADPHFTLYNAEAKNPNAYNAFKQIGGVDAFLIAGDLTHDATTKQYNALMECVNAYTKNNSINPDATGDAVDATILSMGNHEFSDSDEKNDDPCEKFTEYTGQQPDALYWISGIPVISISPDPNLPERAPNIDLGNNYDLSYDFLKGAYEEIDDSGYDGLIIMIAHHRTNTKGKENSAWSEEMLSLMKAHPNTMIFTGHSHTWIENTGEFILQDAGFTHVRAGSLGNNYGGFKDGTINPNDGKSDSPLEVVGDSNCSCVLVDIMEDGTAKIRRLDLAKGRYMFPDEEFVIRPGVLTDYLKNEENENFAKSYGYGAKDPSFSADAKITVEDQGNNSSVIVRFPEAIPATSLAKDFISEYRIRFTDPEGNYLKYEDSNFYRVGNYRSAADEGKDWSVFIHGLAWDTDYTVEVCAVSAYGKTSPWIKMDGTVNVGHGTPTYPAVPVIDFDYSYGSAADGAGHALVNEPKIKDAEVDGQKAVQILGIGSTPYTYEFREEDYRRVNNFFTLECYFNASNVQETQCPMGGWSSTNLGYKIEEGNLYVWANFTSAPAGSEYDVKLLSAPIEANTWVHAITVYDGLTLKLYINGELVGTQDGLYGGLNPISYAAESDETAGADKDEVVKYFCVGAGDYDEDGEMLYFVDNCKINKATLYEGIMTAEDVKTAYEIATTAVPFTDITDTWYTDSVEYAYATGLMNGSSATTFSPSVQTSRAMIVQMLYNLEGRPAVDKSNNPFTDVADTWYTDAILWAYQNGVTTGTSATTFSPDALVTREQVAVFLYRYMRDYKKAEVGEGADLSAYPDEGDISTYTDFKEAVAWANANGIIGGKKSGDTVTLAPLDKAMRSEVAKMFVSFDKKF